jgi:type II secretory pathway component PulJ
MSRVPRTNRDDAGISLIEVAVVVALLGLIMGVVFNTLWGGMRHAAEIDERSQTQAEARLAVDTLVRDLRQSWVGMQATAPIETMTPTTITFLSPDRQTPFRLRRISYRLSGTTLERSVQVSTNTGSPPWTWGAAAGPWVSVLEGVRNTAVFTYRNQAGAITTDPLQVRTVEIALDLERTPQRNNGPQIYRTTVDIRVRPPQ